MTIIKAKYKGFDGVMGYRAGKSYHIIFKERNTLVGLFTHCRIEVWRADNQGLSTGHAKYSSMNSFLLNWDIIPEKVDLNFLLN